jgi:hypothetical protein
MPPPFLISIQKGSIMAKALSHIMSTIRGSVGGLTYSANQFAQIVMKNRIAPVQPNTTAQTAVRSALNAASIAWEGLTQANRDLWDLYATTVTYEGAQGSYQITGRDIFIAGFSLQTIAYEAGVTGQAVNTAPPIIGGKLVLAGVSSAAFLGPGTGIAFGVNNYAAEAVSLLVNVSPAQNTTRNRFKGPWDNTLTQWVPLAASTSVHHEIENLTVGKVYFVRLRGVTKTAPARVTSVAYLRLIAATVV